MNDRESSPRAPGLGRRGFVLGLSTAAATSSLVACGRSRVEPDAGERFDLLSQLLTGFEELDQGLAAIYRASVEADPEESAALDRLYEAGGFYESPPATLEQLEASGALELEPEVADRITMMWYSGVFQTAAGESQVATHLEALCWRAANTNPPTQCGGVLGFWSAPPST